MLTTREKEKELLNQPQWAMLYLAGCNCLVVTERQDGL